MSEQREQNVLEFEGERLPRRNVLSGEFDPQLIGMVISGEAFDETNTQSEVTGESQASMQAEDKRRARVSLSLLLSKRTQDQPPIKSPKEKKGYRTDK